MPKKRIYTEQVTAQMTRINHGDKVMLLRTQTQIRLSTSDRLLGTVIMTNPGSYKMRNHPEWQTFSTGEGDRDVIQGIGPPDTTMQNLIKVVRKAYEPEYPKGYLSVFNITALVEPDGEKIGGYHQEVMDHLQARDIDRSVLFEREVYDQEAFQQQCEASSFIMIGFLNGVFAEEVNRIRDWSTRYEHKLVYALDRRNQLVHPFCWRLNPAYRQQAVERLKEALLGGCENPK
ncbi:hypothetical protein ACFPYJ_05565 [Paenibacillus solisilvae]|uniref:Uncharacterized protein n=1 Tax=Paenibacillus solisilvae TaxID=2486751 RepID=A0ABW0VWZ8_9BACL